MMDVEQWKFDVRQAMLDYGSAVRRGDDDYMRVVTTRGCELVDKLADAVNAAVAAERDRYAALCLDAMNRYYEGNFFEAAGACTHLHAQITGYR